MAVTESSQFLSPPFPFSKSGVMTTSPPRFAVRTKYHIVWSDRALSSSRHMPRFSKCWFHRHSHHTQGTAQTHTILRFDVLEEHLRSRLSLLPASTAPENTVSVLSIRWGPSGPGRFWAVWWRRWGWVTGESLPTASTFRCAGSSWSLLLLRSR